MVFSTEMLKENLAGYANPLDKIKRDCDKGLLFRINRGLYSDKENVNPLELASFLYGPSYISFDTALSYYGLIPERVYSITSASFKSNKNRTFVNCFGRFEFSDIPESVFYLDTTTIEGDSPFILASKEKALCDSLYKWPVVRSVKELKHLLFVEKRIDYDIFLTLDFKKLFILSEKYHKTNLNLLRKYIGKEFIHESID